MSICLKNVRAILDIHNETIGYKQMIYLFITGTVVFTVYGQLILKWRIEKYGALPGGFSQNVMFLINLLFDPFIFSGLVAAFIAALFWMAVMTKADISFAYPIITAGLTLLTVILAVILLGENLNMMKSIGITLIVAGVLLMVRADIV